MFNKWDTFGSLDGVPRFPLRRLKSIHIFGVRFTASKWRIREYAGHILPSPYSWSQGISHIKPVTIKYAPVTVTVHNHVHLSDTRHALIDVGSEDIFLRKSAEFGIYFRVCKIDSLVKTRFEEVPAI